MIPQAPGRVWLLRFFLTGACVVGPPARAQEAGHAAGSDIAIMPFDQRQLDASLSETLTDAFQFEFSRALGRPVLGQQDLVNLMGLEKQKELLGCDAASCVAEIGGALGVRYVVFGRLAKVGQTFLVTVKFMDAMAARLLLTEQESIRVPEDQEAREQVLLDGVVQLAKRLGGKVASLLASAAKVVTPPVASAPPPSKPAATSPPPATLQAPATAPSGPLRAKAARARKLRTETRGGLGNRPWILALAASPLSLCCVVPGSFVAGTACATMTSVGAGAAWELDQDPGPLLPLYGLTLPCLLISCAGLGVGFGSLPLAGFLFAKRNGTEVEIISEEAETPPATAPASTTKK